MGPYQRTPKKVTRAIKYPGLGVRSVGLVGDFLKKKSPRIGRQLDVPNFTALLGVKFQGLPTPKKKENNHWPNPWDLQGTNTPWKINMEVWKIMFLSKWLISRFHVYLPGCIGTPLCW